MPRREPDNSRRRRETDNSRRRGNENENGSNDNFTQIAAQEYRLTHTVFESDGQQEASQLERLYARQQKEMNKLTKRHQKELEQLPADYPDRDELIDVQNDEVTAMQLKHTEEQQELENAHAEQRALNEEVNNADFTVLNQSDLNRWQSESRDNLSLSE